MGSEQKLLKFHTISQNLSHCHVGETYTLMKLIQLAMIFTPTSERLKISMKQQRRQQQSDVGGCD
jgi:hypothetical protein